MSEAPWWEPRWGVDHDEGPEAGWNTLDIDPRDPSDHWAYRGDPDVPVDEFVSAIESEFQHIRSRDRVRDLAEVFTHHREVDAMLDLVSDAFSDLDVKFLEPAAGSGNFVVEILRRKLTLVVKRDTVSQEQYEHRMLRAIASIYAVDISPQNVTEARIRLAHVLLEHYQTDANTAEPTPGFLSAANTIIHANILVGDTITGAFDIELCDWQPRAAGCFQRVWSTALVPEAEQGLFAFERVQDAEPVHYSRLATGLDVAAMKET